MKKKKHALLEDSVRGYIRADFCSHVFANPDIYKYIIFSSKFQLYTRAYLRILTLLS